MHGQIRRAVGLIAVVGVGLALGCEDQLVPPKPDARSAQSSNLDVTTAAGSQPDSDWISTPAGWFHRSCVYNVPSGSRWDRRAGVLYRPDGSSMTIPPCRYAHGARRGQNGVPVGSAPTDSGWSVWRYRNSATPYRSLSAYWHVPDVPSSGWSGNSDYYTFPGLQDSLILQPVLAYHFPGGASGWSITSVDCDASGANCFFSTDVGVSPGDSLHGVVQSSNCSAGKCDWQITTYDVTAGTWTQLFVSGGDDDYTQAVAGAIEVHGLNTCTQMPSNPVYVTGITLTDRNGAVSSPSWQPDSSTLQASPNCWL
jgi:hypothetical protein